MPRRTFSRDHVWLLPPTVHELIPADYPVRFVAAFVDEFDEATWRSLGVSSFGEAEGAPAYHPALLTSVWLYGFMTGVRSCRKLEAACRDHLSYIWLTGNQRPDHNTLWRFYQEHRQQMRKLLKRTVRTAAAAGLVDLALQAVDGTKVAGNAAKDRTYSAAGLERLLQRTDAAIADLEAQNRTAGEAPPPRLPERLRQAEALQEQVKAALEKVTHEEGRSAINLTDEDAVLLKSRHGFVAGYNAQAVTAPITDGLGVRGMFITAADVCQDPDDHRQLLPMLEAAVENTGKQADVTLADAGYHSGENLRRCAEMGQAIIMPEAQAKALAHPYHKDAFVYEPESDTYLCPQGKTLSHTGVKHDRSGRLIHRYRAPSAACRACPAFGLCTKDRRGRTLEIGPDEVALGRHRALMRTAAAKTVYSKRKELNEPTFGIIKEQQAGRRLLLRGVENTRAEWSLLSTGFNLRTLARIWRMGILVRRPGYAWA